MQWNALGLIQRARSLLKSVTWSRCILCLHTQTHSCGGVCVYTVYIYFEAQKVTVVEFFEIMMHSCGVPRWPMRVTFLLRLMLSRYSPWYVVGLVSPLTNNELMPLMAMHCINASLLSRAKFYAQSCLRQMHEIRGHSIINNTRKLVLNYKPVLWEWRRRRRPCLSLPKCSQNLRALECAPECWEWQRHPALWLSDRGKGGTEEGEGKGEWGSISNPR